MDKKYNLTEGYGEKVADKAPEWMDDILKTLDKPKEKKPHPFYGINDPILNPERLGVEKK